MKAGIHPAYNVLKVTCACGHSFETRSTHKGDMRVEICSNCHPFFTGKQKLMDTEGRVDRLSKSWPSRLKSSGSAPRRSGPSKAAFLTDSKTKRRG